MTTPAEKVKETENVVWLLRKHDIVDASCEFIRSNPVTYADSMHSFYIKIKTIDLDRGRT